MKRLDSAACRDLPDTVSVPTYDRAGLGVGIVHIGVGGFHRAHQAWYLGKLIDRGLARDWAICGVGLLEADTRMRDALAPQDGLYTLVEKYPDGRLHTSVVGSIVEVLHAPSEPETVIERMAAPTTRIVSLTITEGGYNVHPVTGSFNAHEPAVAADLQPAAVPRTVFGFVVEALARRRAHGIPPFTVMSCDNIEGNGHLARRMFGAFARLRDPELGEWVEKEVAFPNSMVDRITPVTSDADRDAVAALLGVNDAWPVVCEPFSQWVLEEHFPLGRPEWEQVGVQVVPDVRPYELMKLRLLNASHQALGYLGYLSGYEYVHEVAQDPLFAGFLRAYMDEEVTPTLDPLPGIDLDQYKTTVLERFANPQVRDTLTRICAETSERIPKFLLPVIRELLERGGRIQLSALVIASWARYAEGVDEHGNAITVVDPLREALMAAASRNHDNPTAFLEVRDVFGDLADDQRFVATYVDALHSLHESGARGTLERIARTR